MLEACLIIIDDALVALQGRQELLRSPESTQTSSFLPVTMILELLSRVCFLQVKYGLI